jgi:hypothetical protein
MGPCVKILLRNTLSDEQFRKMDSWLVNKSKSFEGTPGYREVWIDQGTFSGCPDDEPCCISWEVFLDQETNHPVLDHLVDTAFLEAWLRHPHYHMIK